jgi:hypothetical protein
VNKLLPLLLAFLALTSIVYAAPVAQDPTIQPSYLWLGESVNASVNCTDDNSSISQAYVNIIGPVLLPTFSAYNSINGIYQFSIDKGYFDRTGAYQATFYCENALNQNASNSSIFTFSSLSGRISGMNPYPAYTGDVMEIDFMVNKSDGTPISSDVTFIVSLNGKQYGLKLMPPAYDSNRGWILKIDSPPNNGTYNINVTAFYDRTSVSNYSTIDVGSKVYFGIESIDRTSLNGNDNVTLTLRAEDMGSAIDLNANNLKIRINSADVPINSISKRNNLFDVRITAPSLPSNMYNLETFLSYNGQPYSDSQQVDYMVDVSGDIVDANNKAIPTQIKFLQGGLAKMSIATDSYGHYSDSIVPGTYDIEFNFPLSTLYLRGATVSSFDDPIKYYYGDDFGIPGIRNAGLNDFEVSIPYSSADVEVSYTEKNVLNENNLRIFRCPSWNSGRKVCNSDWSELNGILDTVRNKAKINSTSLSAFVVGEVKNIVVEFSTDRDVYNIGDSINVKGLTKDEDRNSVSNASIQVYLRGLNQLYTAKADSNGIFSLDIPAPTYEGTYELDIKATSYPYGDFLGNKSIIVTKSKDVMIEFPDTIKMNRGENLTQNISIANTGQADVSLGFFLDGLQDGYYVLPGNTSLKAGERKTLSIDLLIPFFAQTGVSSATLKVQGSGISQEKVFGLSIVETQESNQTSPTGYAGSLSMPIISFNEATYIVIFALACFSASIALKKMRIAGNDNGKIRSNLFDAKKQLSGRGEPAKSDDKYDKVILTEFPNFMRFSKKLVRDGENGKDY